jgi:hypothetical protein
VIHKLRSKGVVKYTLKLITWQYHIKMIAFMMDMVLSEDRFKSCYCLYFLTQHILIKLMEKSKLIDATRQYDTVTDNGAVTHSTSLNKCLDLFFIAGASRNIDERHIINCFSMAVVENKHLAFRILFWARDCRGGAGEKRFFRVIAKYCIKHMQDDWQAVSTSVPEYGSWKDVFEIETPNSDILNWLSIQLIENGHRNLLAKYFPRKGPWFTGMHKYLRVKPKDFRKSLVALTNVVETKLCNKDYDAIEYSKVPSVAMNMYKNVFMSKDADRFNSYIEDVMSGDTKINSSVLFPHQVINSMNTTPDSVKAAQAQWDALPDYMEGSSEKILPVCDVSASMLGLPMDVCVALGMYISERNESIFKDAFITFTETPTMQYVQGDNLLERLNSISDASWGYSTNLQATFDLVLNSALREKIPASQMPTKLLIISDMEFDEANGSGAGSNLDYIRRKYSDAGYTMPEIIFWNVNGRVGNVPASKADKKVGLVSGFSPSILTSILQGQVETPEELMLRTVNAERYNEIENNLKFFGELPF